MIPSSPEEIHVRISNLLVGRMSGETHIVKKINSLHTGQLKFGELGEETFNRMKETFLGFSKEVLGLKVESDVNYQALINTILKEYKHAKYHRDFERVDEIRAQLKAEGIVVKDMKDKIEWAFEE